MIQKRVACSGEFNTTGAALKQLGADFLLDIAYLAAERWLRGVQPPLGGELEAAFFSDSHEVTKVPQLHRRPYASQA